MENTLDLTQDQKEYACPGGDVVTVLQILSDKAVLQFPIDADVLNSLLTLSDRELMEELKEKNLNTGVIRGEAVMQLYRYRICEMQTGSVTFTTQQTFVVNRKAIDCNSVLGRLAFWSNDVTVDSSQYNSEDFAELLASLDADEELWDAELLYAVSKGNVAHGVSNLNDALVKAVWKKNLNMVKLFAENGATNIDKAYNIATLNVPEEIADYLSQQAR